jgi:uncharacterized Zn-finger protein
MDTNSLINNQWLSRILLTTIIIISAVVMYAINEIDRIINVQLYDYNLLFSFDWANPYWGLTKIIYIGLGATIIMSITVLLLGFIKTKTSTPTLTSFKPEKPKTPQPIKATPEPIQIQPKTQPPPTPKAKTSQPANTVIITTATGEQPKTKPAPKQKAIETQTGLCPSCKKSVGQPLVMLDFEGGKSKLVNVCPYCNQVLGDTEQKIE